MKTQTSYFTCDRCGLSAAAESEASGPYFNDQSPKGWSAADIPWAAVDDDGMRRNDRIDLCGACYQAFYLIREIGDKRLRSWFDEKEHSEAIKD